MGRIKKAAGAKHEATLPRGLAEFIQTAVKLPLLQLRPKLLELPFHWPFPRGDLYHWIPLLDHFDVILEEFIKEYDLKNGPQTRAFGSGLLQRGLPDANRPATEAEIKEQGYGPEGDRELVEAVILFSRLLHENCGNRSLYASSDRLGEILNTTSLSLLCATLRLAARLAIRYHHSYQRGPNSNAHANAALRASHYNIDLDHVQLVAESLMAGLGTRASLRPRENTGHSRDGQEQPLGNGGSKKAASIAASDMLGIATSGPMKAPENVVVAFSKSTLPEPPAPSEAASADPFDSSPSARRAAGPARSARRSSGDGASVPNNASPNKRDPQISRGGVTVSLSREEMLTKSTHDIMAEYLPTIAKANHFEFLSRVRATKALLGADLDRQLILSARILALTNLAYVYPESLFHQKILHRDADEPPQLQIVQQLASLVYPPNTDGVDIPLWLRTIALGGLEAFAKHKSRATEVYAALSVNASHGVLLFILRKTVAELEGDGNETLETHEWNEALVSLLDSLTSSASRTAEALVGAGLLEILVDVLKLRGDKAERWHHRVIGVLSLAVNTVRDAFQTFVNCKGLDAVSELISWEVSSSIERVQNNQGFPELYKSHVTDYQLPYFQQQTLRWLFKFVNHMMTHNNALFDRVLRNLIDSPPLLKGLRDVLANGDIFGSTIWSGAVNILSSFIHNEPTSYAVIAEAGLSKTLLESILRRPLAEDAENTESDPSWSVTFTGTEEADVLRRVVRSGQTGSYQVEKEQDIRISRSTGAPLAKGILPATDAINAIPAAFGAICLNNSGLDMFLKSGSLEAFFEVFESREHVRSLAAETNLPKVLGQHFDELVRHHPRLKSAVTQAIVLMVARVGYLCNARDRQEKSGARLWTADSLPPASPRAENGGDSSAADGTASTSAVDDDVVMGEPPNGTLANGSSDKDQDELKTTTYLGIMARFLSGYFDNHSLCGNFLHSGGLEFLLEIATSPCLPHNFSNVFDSHDLCHVFHVLIEYKPHLVLPAIVNRLTSSLEQLEPLMNHRQSTAFFSKFTEVPSGGTAANPPVHEDASNVIIKAMVSVHLLLNILHDAFLTPPYGSRSSHSLFNQVNLADSYLKLIKTLGRLYRVCVWEEIQLQNAISEDLKQKTRVNGYGMGSDEADEIFGFRQGGDGEEAPSSQPMVSAETPGQESSSPGQEGAPLEHDRAPLKKVLRLNVISLRYLLSQIPSSITPFLQGLGRSLVPKRRIDPYQRQNAFMVADALGEVALENLQYDVAAQSPVEKDRFAYWIVAITSLSHLLIEGADGRSAQISCLTLVLHAFKSHGGLEYTNELLHAFSEPLREIQDHEEIPQEKKGLYTCLAGGMKLLLMFYGQITSHKVITEAPQSHSLANTERDRESVFYFAPAQLLMGLRLIVLSAVSPIWDSTLIDHSASPTIKCLIDILKNALQADASPLSPPSVKSNTRKGAEFRPYPISSEKEASLKARNIPADLAREALYRCMNGREAADEYCDAHTRQVAIPRLPIPDYESNANEILAGPSTASARQNQEDSTTEGEDTGEVDSSAAVPAVPATLEETSTQASAGATGQPAEVSDADVGDGMAMSIDNLLNIRETPVAGNDADASPIVETKFVPLPHRIPEWQNHDQDALQQFEDLRSTLRSSLIEKALDILTTHHDVTFELADLLLMATTHGSNASTVRSEMATTLVSSLASMSEDDLRPQGKKIASVANLLAIVIQEKEWFDTVSGDLKSFFGPLLGFVRVMPDQKPDEPSPWVSQTLLVLEKLLSEDAQPPQIKWTPPTADNPEPEQPIAEVEEPLVSQQEKEELFRCLVDILPRVGKDQLLALSITRILAVLTRDRGIASQLAEKRNIQRLFVMMKQLAGAVTEKFHSTFMLILRHMMEDEESIRKIIRSEIIQAFRSRARPVDTSVYVRTMHAYVLRSPSIFLEITNEMLKLQRFDTTVRPQILLMKDVSSAEESPEASESQTKTEGQQEGQPSTSDMVSPDTAQPSTEDGDVELKLKRTMTDPKFPTLEYADGVVHYILSQLLAYKDIEDREPDQTTEADQEPSDTQDMDIEKASTEVSTTPPTQDANAQRNTDRKVENGEHKPEQHPIYFYRCFLLQCLSELLMSYGRAKIEFINFSRRADSKANTTPSKPRSVVLNYILHSLVPINRLDKVETVAFKKSLGTSNWAMSVIVSLCLRTNENLTKREMIDEEPDPDLTFVRKFVLEQALKAFKDAQTTSEGTPVKYAKILSLADLFTRILNGRVLPTLPGFSPESSGHTIKEVAKIMYEKAFIASLTNSIADIDLNVDNAKRVVKYVLRPLKTLTQTAVHLSQTSDLSSSSGPADEDEISTATSVSENEDGREETPDLFRHSVLGTLDPGREEESSSESDDEADEDMYDDYDDGADYDEDIPRDDDEVMSDEDDELDEPGRIEGLPGDVGVAFEVVMGSDGGDETEDESDEDGSEEDDEDDDMDDDDQIIEEITADDENDSLEDDENEWEDEDEDGNPLFTFNPMDPGPGGEGHTHRPNIPIHMDIMEADDEVINSEPASAANLELHLNSARYGDIGLPSGPADEDDEDDEDGDDDDQDDMDDDDDEMLYPDYDEEDGELEDSPWGWDAEENAGGPPRPLPATRHIFHHPTSRHHHHHPHQNHLPHLDPWSIFTPQTGAPDRMAQFRPHPQMPRDDNVNPLLQRDASSEPSARRGPHMMSRVGNGLRDVFSISATNRESPISLINNMMQAVGAAAGQGIDLSHGAFHLHIGGPGGGMIPFPREIQSLMGARHAHEHLRPVRDEPFYLPLFYPMLTGTRWAEEARLLYGGAVNEKTQRVINSLLKLLVPPAIEEEKIRKEKEAEALKKKREEDQAREERLAKERAEQEEKEQKEREEQEAKEAAEREAVEREAAEQRARETTEQSNEATAMEGVESTQDAEASGQTGGAEGSTSAEPSGSAVEPQERVRATFRGREVDITHLGIDLEYLNALPENLREEVLMQQLSEQRSQQAVSGEQPTEYDREFLNALPANIREEILAQEAQDRRRREREEARRQANAEGGPASARAEDMDTASFLASLDPVLRHAVLLEQDEDMINQLPAAIAAEARALGAERGGMHRWGEIARQPRHEDAHPRRPAVDPEATHKKAPRKQVVQMLDKAGVATLLRILFVSPHGSSRETLNAVLQNASQNRQNRAEILGIILSVLQDGTTDTGSVEKSFTQLSVRAKQQGSQKTPQPLKRSLTGSNFMAINSDMTPLAVMQHCLNALGHLTEHNPHAPTFFLTEHDNPTGLKTKASKKGKAKDTLETKYPINALLSLLDRKIVMDSTSCLEQLSSLLQTITQPLAILRHQRDEPAQEDTAKDPAKGEPDAERVAAETAEEPPVDAATTTDANEPQSTTEEAGAEKASENTDTKNDGGPKKQRKYTPPHIPEHNLRLVVNIVSARECSGKTFRDTLSTINNLSVIPDAKETFGRELFNQSQSLADAIIFDLDFLTKQVQRADSNDEIHGVALSKFSPSSSDQAKLLRVLTALDYIFDPKRGQTKNGERKPHEPADSDSDGMLASLYESQKFGLLWNKLSECLKAMRQRDSKTATAAILLPLIEALMVVCKNAALKESFAAPAKEFQITSPGPDTTMEGLFFRFTEEHRKVLNDLVRQNPRLMSGTFSLLVENPKVLEFDNKRNYFSRKLHSRTDMRRPQPPLQLSVRRDQTFTDSYRTLYFKSADEIKYGKLSIRFHGEEGVDAGGVTREWFQTMSRQMFNPDYALFTPVASDRTTFHPNKDSYYNEDHLAYFKFIGRIIGKALYEGRALDCHFSRAVYKRILGKSVSIKDMETLDLDYYRSLVWMLENDISDIITETFSVQTDVFGASEVVDLVENGSNIPVTEENKQEYVQLVVEYRLTGSVKAQLDEFLRGFHDIVPAELIKIFNEQELELLISGLPDIDVDDWKNHTDYHNYSASSAQIQWFWRAVRSFDKEERAKLLQFVTGTAKVPLNGFKELEGMNGFSRFNIHRDYGNKQRLPSSHTCFNQLDLPEYDDYETLRQQLYTAMTAGSSYFGFA